MANTLTTERIVAAADQLFYQQGFEHTSFTQIAEAVGISRGNFYYHFKTKDDILHAVISRRLLRTSSMLDNWELAAASPATRIRSFINILLINQANIKQYGCPIGSLSTELVKLKHPAKSDASALFTLFRIWLRRQFELLGHNEDADQLAMHLLAFSQGVATLASAFEDDTFIQNEVSRLDNWLTAVTNKTNTQPEVL